MIGILGTGGILSLVVLLAWIERKRAQFKWTSLSPFALLAFPLVTVLIVQEYSIHLYSLDELSILYLAYTMVHLFLVWIVCLIFEGSTAAKSSAVTVVSLQDYEAIMPLMVTVGVLAAALQIISFILGAGSVSMIGAVVQEEFQNEYSGGLNYYLRLTSMLCSAYFIAGINRRRKVNILLAVMCLLPVFLTFVKSVLLISIVSGVIGNIIVNGRKIKLKQVLFVLLIGIAVFFGVYLVEICIWDIDRLFDAGTYEYIFAKMNFYLISGVQSFNIRASSINQLNNFIQTENGNLVLAPLMNILNWLGFDSRMDTASNVWTLIGFVPNYGIASGNVYSYIGQLVLYCGFVGSLMAEIVFTSIVCFFYSLFHLTGKTTALLAYAFLASFFVLGWFDDYFCQTFWVYSLCILGIINIIFGLVKTIGAQRAPRRIFGARQVR